MRAWPPERADPVQRSHACPAATLTPGETRVVVPKSDIDILNYALTLEHIEATFYRTTMRASADHADQPSDRAVRGDIHRGPTRRRMWMPCATAAIKQLGGVPIKEAMYKFPPFSLPFGITVENLGVHAYLGAAPLIKTPSLLLTAASIVTVEARHAAAWMTLAWTDNNKQSPVLGAFDTGLPKAQVVKAVTPFFVK